MTEEKTGHDSLVLYSREGHVGAITLNRPEKRNALNPKVWNSLDAAVAQAEADSEARVVLLKGAGKSFCAGLDLSLENNLFAFVTEPPSAAMKVAFYREVRHVQEIHTRLDRLTKPTIAVIQLHCLGAGLEMVLCCDIRLCSAGTTFSLPEARLGFITDIGGLQRLGRVVGPGHAREIAYRAHRFDAERAREIDLVNYVYPDEATLLAKAQEMAEEIAGNPPMSVQGAKEVFLFDEEATLDESLDYNAARSSMIVPSEDMTEAISAYMEKRTGVFKGK